MRLSEKANFSSRLQIESNSKNVVTCQVGSQETCPVAVGFVIKELWSLRRIFHVRLSLGL